MNHGVICPAHNLKLYSHQGSSLQALSLSFCSGREWVWRQKHPWLWRGSDLASPTWRIWAATQSYRKVYIPSRILRIRFFDITSSCSRHSFFSSSTCKTWKQKQNIWVKFGKGRERRENRSASVRQSTSIMRQKSFLAFGFWILILKTNLDGKIVPPSSHKHNFDI